MKKIIICMLFSLIIVAGCVKSETEPIPTEAEKSVITYEFSEEKSETFKDGKVYVYEYFFCENNEEINGKVYILSLPAGLTSKAMAEIADSLPLAEQDFAVLDCRRFADPDMQIRNSYRAEGVELRKCIIEILLKYEENHPSEWERSYASMENEWNFHNFSYFADYDVERSKHVDLNNKDEELYQGPDGDMK